MTMPANATSRPAKGRVAVTDSNIRKAAARLLTCKLVSTEMMYVQRTLGQTATQDQLDAQVLAVRSLPWSEIAEAD